MTANTVDDLGGHSTEDIFIAGRHLEDLEVFVGQRSRMHPGPGWAVVLQMVRQDLAVVRGELARRQPGDGSA